MIKPIYPKGTILFETMFKEYMEVKSYDYRYDVYSLIDLKNPEFMIASFARTYVENISHFVPQKITLTPLWRLLHGYE